MPKCIVLLPCDWLISNLCYQAIEQVYIIKWPVSVQYVFSACDQSTQSQLLRQLTARLWGIFSLCMLALGGFLKLSEPLPAFLTLSVPISPL